MRSVPARGGTTRAIRETCPQGTVAVHDETAARAGAMKGCLVVLYDEPHTIRFLAAIERLKKKQLKAVRNLRLVKQRLRSQLRKLRSS
jgi:hypothetical protein